MTKSADLFAQITDRIATQIEAGVAPWRKPWTATEVSGAPRNLAGRVYRGGNFFWLSLVADAKGYPTSVWGTYNQIAAAGGSVRKGEKATPVFFWSFSEKTNEQTGKVEKLVWAKAYNVFNAAQCDGLEIEAPAPKSDVVRHAEADAVIAATGAVIRHGGDRAFYSPVGGYIGLPHDRDFVDVDAYYATAFHEIGHWTGAASRLDRAFGKRFGDDAYAMEELVAELTAAYVCASVGIGNPDREDHAAYLGHWARILRADPRAFITAAGKAQAAADYILAGAAVASVEPLKEAA